jgi:sulfite reductase beta subunit-like hemoprotein
VLDLLDGLFADYADGRQAGEPFGDFLLRTGRLDQAQTARGAQA